MTSIASKLMVVFIRLRGSKKLLSSVEATRNDVESLIKQPHSYAPPKSLAGKVDIQMKLINGWPVYAVSPPGVIIKKSALYAHGGAWIHEISPLHWELIAKLTVAAQTQFIVPIYPLAPAGTAQTVVTAIADLAADLIHKCGSGNVTLMGDSAGGTIALCAAMLLRDRGLPAIRNIILISPALDLHLDNPLIDQVGPVDPFLAKPGLQYAAELWRGELSLNDPMVSPMFGELKGLAPITLFSSTSDILNPDARAFVKKAKAAGFPVNYHEAPEMIHVYPLLPMPEAKEPLKIMEDLLRR